MNVHKIAEHPEYFEKPDNNDNYDNNIQYGFNFMIHGDICIDKPKKNAWNN